MILDSEKDRLMAYKPALNEQSEQVKKWGVQNHHPHKYLTILIEEVGEVGEAILKTEEEGKTKTWDDVIEELVQVEAVAQSMIESIKRNQLELL